MNTRRVIVRHALHLFAAQFPSRAARLLRGHGGLVTAAVFYAAVLALGIESLWLYGGFVKEAGWTWERTSSCVLVRSVDPQGSAALLTPGARIIAVNGDQRAAVAGPRPWLQTVTPGQSYLLEWRTADGSRQQALVSMSRRRLELDLEMGLCDLFLSLCFAAVGFLVWVAKPRDLVARWCSAAALLFAFYLAASAIGPVSPQFSGVVLAIYFLLKAIFPFHMIAGCALFARFPTGEAPRKPWRFALRALWVLGAVVWIVILPQRLFPFLGLEWRMTFLSGLDLATRPELAMVPLRHGFIVLCGLFLFGVMLSNYRRLISEAMRLRIRWVTLGTLAGIAPGALYSLTVAFADATNWLPPETVRSLVRLYSVSTISLAAIPASIAYAILCHRLMGIRMAFTNGMHFLYARRVIQIVTILPAIPLGIHLWRHRSQPLTESLSRPVMFVPLIGLSVILLLRKELLDAGNLLLAHFRYNRNRVMEDLLEALFEQNSTEGIARTAAARLDHALRPARLLVCCAESDSKRLECVYASDQDMAVVIESDSALATALSERGPAFLNSKLFGALTNAERGWVSRSGLVLAAPIAGELKAELSGIIFLGEKLSGERYEATDLDLVEDAARQVYLALKMHELQVARDRALHGRQQAEESGRTRSQFMAQIGHELHQPLNGLVGFTDLLLDTPLRDDQKEYAELIRRSSEWVATIANDMLDLARIDAGKLRLDRIEFEWLPMLEDLAMIAAARACEKNIEVVLRVDDDMPLTSCGDPTRIRQVLLNLLDNAVKFTEQGWVLMHARSFPNEARRQSILVTIEDTGPGIPDEYRSRLFQPYEQSAAAAGRTDGAGLGLAISKRLTDAIGGELTLETTQTGHGTTFSFSLPAVVEGVQLPPKVLPLRGICLLCIDPLPVSLGAIGSSLSGLGARVIAISSESDLPTAYQYDAVILSANEVRDAIRAVRECRRMWVGVPVVCLYRHQPIPLGDAAALGRLEQIRRPPSRKALLGAVERAVALRRDVPAAHYLFEPLVTRDYLADYLREHGGNRESMDLDKVLSDLRAEREQVEQAYLALSRLAVGQNRRGRPPKWMAQIEGAEPKKRRGRPPGTKNKPKT